MAPQFIYRRLHESLACVCMYYVKRFISLNIYICKIVLTISIDIFQKPLIHPYPRGRIQWAPYTWMVVSLAWFCVGTSKWRSGGGLGRSIYATLGVGVVVYRVSLLVVELYVVQWNSRNIMCEYMEIENHGVEYSFVFHFYHSYFNNFFIT